MCGIYGIVGKTTTNIVLDRLESLEYRGYDSCGIAYINGDSFFLNKSIGNVGKLRNEVTDNNLDVAIGHTRWATHGVVNVINAHPHSTANDRFYIVHNGMIDNYKDIIDKFKFKMNTETDSEVISHLLDYFIPIYPMLDSIKQIQKIIKGTYAIVILDKKDKNKLYFLKNKSPLLLAINKNSVVLSSDQIAFDNETNVTILNDYNYGYIENNSYHIMSNDNNERWNTFYKNDDYRVNKSNSHYMLDEILYQDKMILEIANNYKNIDVELFIKLLDESDEIVFTGAGSSYYASMILSLYYERRLKKRCFAIIASELTSFNILKKNTLFIFLSQSGETADLCTVMQYLKDNSFPIVSLCNNVNSTIGYNSKYIFPLFAKKEVSVASTKAFVSMIYIGKALINKNLLLDSSRLSNNIRTIFRRSNEIKLLAMELIKSNCVFYIGKDFDYPIALEGALKLREISYIHSFAFPSGELKHGSIALIDNKSFALGIVTNDLNYNLVKNNLEEIRSRGGKAYLLSNCYMDADYYIKGDDICILVFLQLLAYYSALFLNRNIDQPRNLAKSVTVL